MRIIALSVIASALLAATAAQAQTPMPAPAQDCKLAKIDTLDMEVSDKALMIPVAVNAKPLKFRITLAATNSAITRDLMKEQGVAPQATSRINLFLNQDGYRIKEFADLPQFQLGHLPAQKFRTLVLPSDANIDAPGEIGTGTLSLFNYDLDPAQGKMNLFLMNHCPGQVVYWTRATPARVPFEMDGSRFSNDVGYMRATLTLDGKPLTAALSTTGPSTISITNLLNIFGVGINDPRLTLVPGGVPGIKTDPLYKKIWTFPFKALTADGLTIGNPLIYVTDADPNSFNCHKSDGCFGLYQMTVGLSTLSKLHIFVSNKEKVLYITPADAH